MKWNNAGSAFGTWVRRKAVWPLHFICKLSHLLFSFNIIFMRKTDRQAMTIQTWVFDRHFVKKWNCLHTGKQLTALVANNKIPGFLKNSKFWKNYTQHSDLNSLLIFTTFLMRLLVIGMRLNSSTLYNKIGNLYESSLT